MPGISPEDARKLAREYYLLAVSLGKRRFADWDKLSATQRQEVESREWTLLTYSSDMTSRAMIATAGEVQMSVGNISAAAVSLRKAIGRTDDVRVVIRYATRAVTLAAAIFSGNAEAIATAIASATD
jgi:hypothetical protein